LWLVLDQTSHRIAGNRCDARRRACHAGRASARPSERAGRGPAGGSMSESTERVYAAPREWAHVHPVSPLLGGWAVVAGVVGYWFTAGPGAPGDADQGQLEINLPLTRLALFVLLGAVVAVGFGYIGWWFH